MKLRPKGIQKTSQPIAERLTGAPRNFHDFQIKFKLGKRNLANLQAISELLGKLPKLTFEDLRRGKDSTTPKDVRDRLKELALEYIGFFREHPTKTHLFPMLGMTFQYLFALGVRDALGIETPIHTTLSSRYVGAKKNTERLKREAKDFNLKKTGIAIHDYVGSGDTIRRIYENVGLPTKPLPSEKTIHYMDKYQDNPRATFKFPGTNKPVHISKTRIFEKNTENLTLGPSRENYVQDREKPSVTEPPLTTQERNYIRRAVYAAGVAAAREIMEEERQKK